MVLAGHAKPYLPPLRIGMPSDLLSRATMRVRAMKHYYLVDPDTFHNPAIVDYLVD